MESPHVKGNNPPIAKIRNQVTEIEMIYRHKVKSLDRIIVNHSQDAYLLFSELWSPQIGLLEECHLLLLDRACRILGHTLISKGNFHSTLVDPKVIFACALKARATSIILAHNHPSGSLKPSHQDISLTKKLVAAGKFLELPLNDHLILSPEGNYFSFADEGLLDGPPF